MLKTFFDFGSFESEAKKIGVAEDLRSLLTLDFTFFEKYPNYAIINVKDYGDEPNNLLVLSEAESILYSPKKLSDKDYALFRHPLEKRYGESTVLAYLVMREALKSYSERFEKLNTEIDELEVALDAARIDAAGKALRKLTDKVEDFLDVMLKLEDRQVPEVNTTFVQYDYDVLTAKSRHLLDRCRSHIGQITELRNDIEVRATKELNLKIADLTNIMKKLTSITVILMIPSIITSHYGMNFKYMPELNMEWGYLGATALSLVAMAAAAIFLRKKGWL